MSPCMNCPHRKLVCHDYCEEYQAWHEPLVRAKEESMKRGNAGALLVENFTHRRDRWRRRNKKLS